MRTCYDPEIPVNIVDLGLIYDCQLTPLGHGQLSWNCENDADRAGCGMGPMLAQDVQNRLLAIEGIDEANVELVWEPPWNQGMMTEAAKLQLGLLFSGRMACDSLNETSQSASIPQPKPADRGQSSRR